MQTKIPVLLLILFLSFPCFAQQPRIDSIAVDEDKGELVLHGDFQNSASAVVLVEAVSLPVTFASDTLLRATIPLRDKSSCGWVKTSINGIESNARLLSYIHIDIFKDYRLSYGGGGDEHWSRDYHIHIRADYLNLLQSTNLLLPISRLSNLDSSAGGDDGVDNGYKYTGPNYNYLIDLKGSVQFNTKDRVFRYQGANITLDNSYEVIPAVDPSTVTACQFEQGYCFRWFAHTPTDFPPSTSSVHEATSNLSIFRVHLSSNPVKSNADVIVTLENPMNIQIQILDILGHIISFDEKMLEAAENKFSINASALSPGMYICRLQAGGEVVSLRFVKE